MPPDVTVTVGSRVRIKVSGRRMKGFVTALFDADPDRKLLSIEGVSGSIPSFDTRLLATLRWASTHYVAPLSVMLRRTVPPTIARRTSNHDHPRVYGVAPGKPMYRIGSAPHGAAVVASIEEAVTGGHNVVVIAPTVQEIDSIAAEIESSLNVSVFRATSSMAAKQVTEAWSAITAQSSAILVGTREVMFWPFVDVGVVVVVEDGRRVMRSQASPTTSVREVVLQRSREEHFPIVFLGPVPTLEALAHGSAVIAGPSRQWPMVEVVDRQDEPPTGALFTEKASAAIRRATAAGEATFVLVGSRGYAPAFRCAACGEVRRCPVCKSAGSRDEVCRRCGETLLGCVSCGSKQFQALGAGIGRTIDDVRRIVGDKVGRSGDGALVTVGSERDLIGVHGMGLAVAVDIDGLTMAPHYRAAEDALRLLVRLCQTVSRGSGRSCLIQTAAPRQAVVACLLSGRSEEFLDAELATRTSLGFPPAGSLIALEIRGDVATESLLTEDLGENTTVLGPSISVDRKRWLIQGRDLTSARIALRPIISTLRNKGATIRIDVDPFDL